ncbi:hypothetical protein D3C81_1596140 [compost metagenome]
MRCGVWFNVARRHAGLQVFGRDRQGQAAVRIADQARQTRNRSVVSTDPSVAPEGQSDRDRPARQAGVAVAAVGQG